MHPIFLHYPISVPSKQINAQPYPTYVDQNNYYFIIPIQQEEDAIWEKYVISNHLHQNNFTNVTQPIRNIHNQFVTTVGKEKFLLCFARKKQTLDSSPGQKLAHFHQTGFQFPYQPQTISTYGNWKNLWVNKIDQYEALYKTYYKQQPTQPIMRVLADVFPYMVGLAENAVQYLNIAEEEKNYHMNDQATLTFSRYSNQCMDDFIWIHEIVYDHPIRDVAESIRPFLLKERGLDDKEFQQFMGEYLAICPLSPFAWKLLYARLLLPIHLFDKIDQYRDSDLGEKAWYRLVEDQVYYEQNLKQFFSLFAVEFRDMDIIQLDWLLD
ncbi:hypothetical protein [Gracilibacillus dipsosauri]|uniref:hypothetical protein n=1 Tax=Gracilibacillus dipsosauri TaxID=178340 RepID=UPI00240926D8